MGFTIIVYEQKSRPNLERGGTARIDNVVAMTPKGLLAPRTNRGEAFHGVEATRRPADERDK